MTDDGVPLHDGTVLRAEAPGRLEKAVRDADLPHVVERGREAQVFPGRSVQARPVPEQDRELADPEEVLGGLLAAQRQVGGKLLDDLLEGRRGRGEDVGQRHDALPQPLGPVEHLVLELFDLFPALDLEAAPLQGIGNVDEDLAGAEGFDDVAEGPDREGLLGELGVVDARDHDRREVGIVGADETEELHPRLARHPDVEQGGGVVLCLERLPGFGGAADAGRLVPGPAQDPKEELADVLVVVHDQDPQRARSPQPGHRARFVLFWHSSTSVRAASQVCGRVGCRCSPLWRPLRACGPGAPVPQTSDRLAKCRNAQPSRRQPIHPGATPPRLGCA